VNYSLSRIYIGNTIDHHNNVFLDLSDRTRVIIRNAREDYIEEILLSNVFMKIFQFDVNINGKEFCLFLKNEGFAVLQLDNTWDESLHLLQETSSQLFQFK
jgi:hypothetical protein